MGTDSSSENLIHNSSGSDQFPKSDNEAEPLQLVPKNSEPKLKAVQSVSKNLSQQSVLEMPEASSSSGEGTSNEAFYSESKEADTNGLQELREATSDEEEAPLPDQVSESASECEWGLPLKRACK